MINQHVLRVFSPVCLSIHICHMINTRWDTARTHRCPIGLVIKKLDTLNLPLKYFPQYLKKSGWPILSKLTHLPYSTLPISPPRTAPPRLGTRIVRRASHSQLTNRALQDKPWLVVWRNGVNGQTKFHFYRCLERGYRLNSFPVRWAPWVPLLRYNDIDSIHLTLSRNSRYT